MTVTELAELSKLSKAYISQVKNGRRPASTRLLDALSDCCEPCKPKEDYLGQFLQSRSSMGVSPKTLAFYEERLCPFTRDVDYLRASTRQVQRYLDSIPSNRNGFATRHATFRAIKTFYKWLHIEFGLTNPINGMPAPILGKPILPSLSTDDVYTLIEQAEGLRDKAIITLFTESGLRLTELTNIMPNDIDWQNRIIKVMGKGRKEAYAPFGELSAGYLKAWLAQYTPDGNIWGLNQWGISSMLRRLQQKTGLPCNPHTFRRTFACLLRKAGVDTMTIKDLGRWESLEMVQRYTRSVSFHDSMKFYKAPLSQNQST
jgi:site-specific recombinase XerD